MRDGKPYPPASIDEVVLADDAEESLRRLRENGFVLLVVTNQPDVKRGMSSEKTVEEIHRFLIAKLPLDGIFACFHDDKDNCACRKPKPGLILDAAATWDVDLGRSYLVGDRWRDIEAGAAAGCRTVLIDHSYNERGPEIEPDIRARSLRKAIDRILDEVKSH